MREQILQFKLPYCPDFCVCCYLYPPKQEGVADDNGRFMSLPPTIMLILLHNVYAYLIFPVSHIDVYYSPLRNLIYGQFSFAGTDTCSN